MVRQLIFGAWLMAAGVVAGEGDGVWTLRLHCEKPVVGVLEGPVDVVLARRDGNFVAGFASANLISALPAVVDWSGVAVESGRVTGKVSISLPPADRELGRTIVTTLDVRLGAGGQLTGQHRVEGGVARSLAFDPQPVSGEITAAAPLPSRWFVELAGRWGKPDLALVLRLLVEEGRVVQMAAYRCDVEGNTPVQVPGTVPGGRWDIPVRAATVQVTGSNLVVTASLEAIVAPGHAPAKFQFDGVWLGTRVVGAMRCLPSGAEPVTGTFMGRLVTGDVLPPVALGTGEREWALDASPSLALMAMAGLEGLEPVRPGEPGRQEFWTWRMIKRDGEGRFIYPPSFGYQEVPGAKSYRFIVKAGGTAYQCEPDKPWRPLTPIWKELPAGHCELRVVALDPLGNVMPTAPLWQYYGKVADGRVAGFDTNRTIRFTKYPTFQGPYAKAPRSYRQAALLAARGDREQPALAATRGLGKVQEFTAIGDYGVQCEIPAALFANSLLLRLSPSASERAEARRMAEEMGWAIQLAARPRSGLPHVYQGNLPVLYRSLAALLDLYRDTGNERWASNAVVLAGNLVRWQEPGGAWRALNDELGELHGPGGYFGSDAREFDPSLLLWQLGRLRHQLRTDRFLEAERKAYRYVMANAARTMEWPELGYHQQPLRWPYSLAGNTAIAFARYLLDYAEPAARDELLAEELLRWSEDRHVDWTRPAMVAPGDPIRPTSHGSSDGFRSTGYPARMAMQQALGWLKLYGFTQRPLHRAKAEALANAVLLAQDPVTGNINISLRAENPSFSRYLDNYGETARELDEFAALWERIGKERR